MIKPFFLVIVFFFGFLKNVAAAQNPELAQLKDIHLPPPVGWWPLAPGWYLVIGVVLILIFYALFLIYQKYEQGKAKREALHLLNEYQKEYQRTRNIQLTCARVSELLKRVALAYFPREQVAALQGEEWLSFLNRNGSKLNFQLLKAELLELPFQPSGSHQNLNTLFSQARLWIQQRRKPCSN